MPSRVFVACLLLMLLNACGLVPAGGEPSPVMTGAYTQTFTAPSTPTPAKPDLSSPTPQIASFTPAASLIPSSTPAPLSTDTPLPPPATTNPVQPTVTAVTTQIPQPAVDSGLLQFLGPGPLSELVSPFYIYGYAVPGFNDTGMVTLYGEDGRVLATQRLGLYTVNKWAWFAWPLSFQVKGAAELGRLSMGTQDEYGRLVELYSVHLLLLSEGNSIITPPGNLKERCTIDQPTQGKWISGGTLLVSGHMRPFNNLPLTVELIDRKGRHLASQLVMAPPAADDSYVPFLVNIPYSINSGIWARLSISQADDRISGLMYLYSMEVYLHP